MRIAEIVGSYADRKEPEIAPDSSLFQTIANAFTRSGKVKRPLDQPLSDGQPNVAHIPFLRHAASDEDPAADAISNTSTDPPTVPTGQIRRPHTIQPFGHRFAALRAVSDPSSSFRASKMTAATDGGRDVGLFPGIKPYLPRPLDQGSIASASSRY